MESEYQTLATEFLAALSQKEKTNLYNDLLALEKVHHLNEHITYYTFKNLKRVTKRHLERRKRSFQYSNKNKHKLVIHQIHEQHFFKNTYRVQIFVNSQEMSYSFAESLLLLLREPVTQRLYSCKEIIV